MEAKKKMQGKVHTNSTAVEITWVLKKDYNGRITPIKIVSNRFNSETDVLVPVDYMNLSVTRKGKNSRFISWNVDYDEQIQQKIYEFEKKAHPGVPILSAA